MTEIHHRDEGRRRRGALLEGPDRNPIDSLLPEMLLFYNVEAPNVGPARSSRTMLASKRAGMSDRA